MSGNMGVLAYSVRNVKYKMRFSVSLDAQNARVYNEVMLSAMFKLLGVEEIVKDADGGSPMPYLTDPHNTTGVDGNNPSP